MARKPETMETQVTIEALENPWQSIEKLEGDARVFVLRYLETASLEEAIESARGRTTRSVVKMLGDPLVRAAIESCAPLVGDSKKAAKLLAPYVLERLSRAALRGSDAQAITAGRDLLAIAGEGPSPGASKPVDLGALVRELGRARDRARMAEEWPNGRGASRETIEVSRASPPALPDSESGDTDREG